MTSRPLVPLRLSSSSCKDAPGIFGIPASSKLFFLASDDVFHWIWREGSWRYEALTSLLGDYPTGEPRRWMSRSSQSVLYSGRQKRQPL